MSELLQNLSTEMAGIVQNVGAGVVRVEARRHISASGIVWNAEGVIVTAHHVVQREDNIKIGLPGDEHVTAELVGRDPASDLAVLKVDAALTPVPWADLSVQSLQVGQFVLALGRPGHSMQASLGVVSALSNEQWRTPGGNRLSCYLQPDVVMYPGFSGGALVTSAGQVAGLNTSAVLRGISLTIPATDIERTVELLLAHGHIKRGYLGVSTQPVRLPAALGEQLGQETGLLLVAVEPDSPADQGGLVLGDTIVAVADAPVRQHDDLMAQLSGDRVGRRLAVKIVRGGKPEQFEVTVGERE